VKYARAPVVSPLAQALVPDHPDHARPCYTPTATAGPDPADVRRQLRELDRADWANQRARVQLQKLLPH
jgi:hypothetical protein